MMERLTNSEKEIPTLVNNAEYWLQVYFKLKDIEDLDEQGLLLRLPCKVGSTVYHIVNKRILEVENVDLFFLCLCVAECRFGKSVFLTQEEAERKLKEIEEK